MISTILSLAITEGVLRLEDYPPAPLVGWKWDHSPYRTQPDTAVNQIGLRGRPIHYGPDDFVVVLLGDSYVEAGAQLPEQQPERILERVLREEYGIANARVFSVASAGWGTDQEYVNLQNYFRRFRADLVLLWFTPNDFWENAYIDRSLSVKAGIFKPTFEINSAGTLQTHEILPETKIQLLWEKGVARLKGIDYQDWRLQRWLGVIPPANTEFPGEVPVCPPTVITQARMFEHEGEVAITVTSPEDIEHNRSHFSPYGKKPSEREKYQIRITQLLLRQVAAEAEANHAKFRFFYAYRPDIDALVSKVQCVRSILSGVSLAFDGADLIRPLDTQQLRPYRITFSLPPTARDLAISKDDVHLNDKGTTLVMQGLSQILLQQGLLRREM